MGFKYTNNNNISLAMAVWLMYDDYDYSDDPTVISATTLLKPLKAIVLGRQNKDLDKIADLSALVNARMGSALHAGIEKAWLDPANVSKALTALGYEHLVDKVLINPEPDQVNADSLCIYIEQRVMKQVGAFKVSGKFDLVINGRVLDNKSTSVWTYIYQSNTIKYKEQGSLYRWANPDKITDDIMQIEFIFTDWSAASAREAAYSKVPLQPGRRQYPQQRTLNQEIALMSIDETDRFVNSKLQLIEKYDNELDQSKIPECKSDDLWETPSQWKYYKNPASKGRATRNFDNKVDAEARLALDKFVGEIVHVPGEVKACRYCQVVGICEQAARYRVTGRLVM